MEKYKKIFAAGWISVCLILSCTGVEASAKKDNEELPELKIGCEEYDPYSYIDENGGLVGIDADIADEACTRMGYRPIYIVMEWNQKEDFLQYGVIDCIWDCFSENGREDEYLWSEPYLYSSETIAVKKDSNIYTIKELDGEMISVQANTRAEELLLKADILPKIVAGNVCSFQRMEEAVSAMKQGYVEAVAGDREFLSKAIGDSEEYRILNKNMEVSRLAVAFKKDGDQELVEKLDKTLEEMKADGTIENILKKYSVTDAKVPKEEADAEK